jgi:sigma-B regulation protein RsbU (phosphoserine phosphatase)
MARQIQASMLPNIFPPFPERPEFDIFASMTPAREVGGDFYDFFMVDDDHLALVIGDVSGKGVAAALFMVIAKTMLKNRAQLGESPKVILEKVNNQLCEGNDAELFVTVWIGIYEISTGRLTAANAGHEYPAICKKGGSFGLYKDRHGFVLAGMEDMRYTEYELELEPGDVLLVYTDGVPEAVDGADQLFTTDRMLYSLDGADSRDPETLVKKLQSDVEHFTGDALQFDDITMLCFRRNR